MLLLAVLWSGCKTDRTPKMDASTDVVADIATDVDVPRDVPVDVDTGPVEDDIAFWVDPYEVRIPCPKSAYIHSAVYPYIIWGENDYGGNPASSEIKVLDVETGNLQVLHSYPDKVLRGPKFTVHPSLEMLHFLTSKAEDAVDDEGVTYRKVTYWLNRLNLADLVVEEIPVDVPFRTPACSQTPNGRVSLLQFSPETGWLTLMCMYWESETQPHSYQDYYRLHMETGAIQMMVDGKTAILQSSLFVSDVGAGLVALQGSALSATANAVEPYFFSVWDVSGETPVETWRLEVPWMQVAGGIYASLDGSFLYAEEGADGFLKGVRLDRNTMEDLGMPAVNHHQFRPGRIHETLSPVVSWTRAKGPVYKIPYLGCVNIPIYSVALYFWDPIRGIVRKITGEQRSYHDPYLMHGQTEPRFLVYYSMINFDTYCLAYKDVIAAGILDETGHLLPEP